VLQCGRAAVPQCVLRCGRAAVPQCVLRCGRAQCRSACCSAAVPQCVLWRGTRAGTWHRSSVAATAGAPRTAGPQHRGTHGRTAALRHARQDRALWHARQDRGTAALRHCAQLSSGRHYPSACRKESSSARFHAELNRRRLERATRNVLQTFLNHAVEKRRLSSCTEQQWAARRLTGVATASDGNALPGRPITPGGPGNPGKKRNHTFFCRL
jgi:hypothetical protein